MKQIFRFFCLVLLFLLICSPCCAGVDFNGDADYIDCGTSLLGDGVSTITITVWVKIDGAQNAGIIYLGTFTGAQGEIAINMDGPNLFIRVNGGAGAAVIGYTDTSSWHCLTMTFDSAAGNNNGKLYVDGSLELQLTNATALDLNGLKTTIGAYYSPSYTLDGKITEVAIWNVALTQDEISLLASSMLKGMPLQIRTPTERVLYLPLDDLQEGGNLAGATFVDRSGNGNDGTGSDANASGGQGRAEEVLSYP